MCYLKEAVMREFREAIERERDAVSTEVIAVVACLILLLLFL